MTRDLPSGTVTFLFTDIEGSTRLVHEHGDAYADLLAEHRRVLREAFQAQGGVEVDTQGDAFFVAFPTAPGALQAAVTGLEHLARGPIQVRMGIHTGTPFLADGGYVGVDVHRAARIAACGHGGQVLVSASTASLLSTSTLRDLGEHRLKDLSAPERIYQLGEHEFPPLKTLHHTNLPVPATPFLGREAELAQVAGLLGREDVHVTTFTGAGGTGKTRLALQASAEAAARYEHGVWWVPLAPIADPAMVLDAAAQALGGSRAADTIGERRLLLLLDNFEHVIEAAPQLSELRAACPNLDILVTSRERLGLAGEQVYPVPVLARAEARELFVSRARGLQPDFEPDDAVDELCSRLDDLPLALELAAARTSILSTSQLLERLGVTLDLLRGGRDADVRQQTLRATIEWSHDLLDEPERQLFARLAVFTGGCTLEAAEAICGAGLDSLESLVDKSLVRLRDGGRFWMLETIREFALERLRESGEEAELRGAHAQWLQVLAESALLASDSPIGPQRNDLVAPEGANLRAAIDWAEAQGDFETGVSIAVAMETYWITDSPFEARRRLTELIERGSVSPLLHARALRAIGGAANLVGDLEATEGLYKAALSEFRALGDEAGVAHMLSRLANLENWNGRPEACLELLVQTEEVLSKAHDPRTEAVVPGTRASAERLLGNLDAAFELYLESASRAREIGFTWWEGVMTGNAAETALLLGRADAAPLTRDSLRILHSIGDRQNTINLLADFAKLEAVGGDLERAGVLWGAVEAEERRAPVGAWEQLKHTIADALPPLPPDAVRRGHALTLDEAVTYALATEG
ncbi:MAG: adenylate/guanylate cyclase domain-containing protein [Thermoleophilia bacterium]